MAKHAATRAAVPVEHKVLQPTAASALLGVLIAVLNALSGGDVLNSLQVPAQFQPIILVVIPPLVTLLTGYLAPHTDRPDLVESPSDAGGALPAGATVVVNNSSAPEPVATPDDEPPATPVCGH